MAKVLIGNFKGPQGEQGVKGDPGAAATIQVGTTQTVQPEENAEVTNSGTANVAVFNFKIPRGADGMTDLVAEYTDDSSYTCQPTANAPVVVKGLDGKTEQVETTGVQLFDAENTPWKANVSSANYEKTETGVNFTTIINSGSAGIFAVFAAIDSAKTYTISMDITVSDKNFNTFMLGAGNDSNNTLYINASDFTENVPYHADLQLTEVQNRSFVIYINNVGHSVGTTVTVENIMLSESQDEAPWEPYTGGQPAPSPDYPQVIKGVGGMGYFDGVWVQGNISSTGAIGTETTGITSANAIPCKQNDNIAVTYEDSIDVIAVAFYNASGAYISTSTSGNSVDTFTATAPANAASFKVNLRFVSGSTITPNGAKYCTVTINGEYQTGVEVTGKNLAEVTQTNKNQVNNGVTFKLNDNGSYTLNGTCTKTDIFRLNQPNDADIPNYPVICKLKAGTKYRITGSQVLVRNSTFPNGTTAYSNAMVNDVFYTPTEDTDVVGIRSLITQGTTYSSTKTYYPGIWEDPDETRTEWVPFKRTSITIPLTSPLYEGDKICYVKPGESYVNADGDTVTADGVLYGCYRENASVVFDGSSDEIWNISGENNRFRIDINNSNNLYTQNTAKCNIFEYKANVFFDAFNEIGFIISRYTFYCRFGSASEINSTSNLKTWLSTNPLTVVYRLAQPYFEPFTDQSIFYNLRTDDILTYIYSSDPIEPNVTVEVAKNSTGGYLLESYATAQKNAISEANSQSRISAIEQQLVNQATTPTE